MEVYPCSVQTIVEVMRANQTIKRKKTQTDNMTIKGSRGGKETGCQKIQRGKESQKE